MDKLIGKELNGEVVNIFEVLNQNKVGTFSSKFFSAGYYASEHQANQSVSPGGYVRKHAALMVRGDSITYYLLEMVNVDLTVNETGIMEKALSKLTDEERQVLGLNEPLMVV